MLTLTDYNQALHIRFGEKEVFHHSPENPSFFIGKGCSTYEMYHGNFDITNELESKYPLVHFEIIENKLETAVIRFFFESLELFVSLHVQDHHLLKMKFEGTDPIFNRFWCRFVSNKNEGIYGCGEQYSKLNLKGSSLPLWVSEQGVGRNKKELLTFFADKFDKAGGDWYTTYFPQPSFITTSNYFCHVNHSSYMEFDFSHDDFSQIECWAIPEEITIGIGKDFEEVIQTQSHYFGLQPKLPDWIFDGMILGLQGGTEEVLPKVNQAIKKGIKLSAIWIQDWEGKRITSFGKQLMWNWQFEEMMYPNLPETIKQLNKSGIRTMGYINPFLATEGALYREASEKQYLLKTRNNEEYLVEVTTFPAAIVDLTNPKAYHWLKDIIKNNMLAIGLSGWMADFGEYLPCDCKLFSGEDPALIHNQFPVLWAKLNREAVEEAGKLGEVVFFTRSGYSYTQKYSTLMWNGDQMVDWSIDDGLPSVIPASLSLGLSGFGISHSDIGGYTTFDNQLGKITRSKELLMRWIEMAAYTPVMRTHEGNRPDLNCQFDYDEETLEHFKRMVAIHVRLKPYFQLLNAENAIAGMPFMRSLYTHYPTDKTKNIQYEYLLGSDLLISPVLNAGEYEHDVFLPEDEWIFLWDEKPYNGGNYKVLSPLGKPPVFVRTNSKYREMLLKMKEDAE